MNTAFFVCLNLCDFRLHCSVATHVTDENTLRHKECQLLDEHPINAFPRAENSQDTSIDIY